MDFWRTLTYFNQIPMMVIRFLIFWTTVFSLFSRGKPHLHFFHSPFLTVLCLCQLTDDPVVLLLYLAYPGEEVGQNTMYRDLHPNNHWDCVSATKDWDIWTILNLQKIISFYSQTHSEKRYHQLSYYLSPVAMFTVTQSPVDPRPDP